MEDMKSKARKIASILLNSILISRIEAALGFKLLEWQKNYILTGEFNPPSGRAVGKTTIYCVKLALSKGPYKLRDIENLRDENHGWMYPLWFRKRFLHIRHMLKERGIKVCEIE